MGRLFSLNPHDPRLVVFLTSDEPLKALCELAEKDSPSREPSPSTCAATPKSAATKRRVSGPLASSAGEQRGEGEGGSR